MIKKKFLCLLLIITMTFSLVACGKKEENSKDKNESNKEITENIEKENNDFDEENGVRKNGKLPLDKSELTDKEKKFYKKEMINAVINLDLEKIKVLVDDSSYQVLKEISDNAEYADMYKKTIGTFIYLEESDAFVAKDIDYIYTKWYTDMWKSNAKLPKEATGLTNAEINAIYNKYYESAPYTANKLGGISTNIENGYIKYTITRIFEYIHLDYLPNLSPTISYENSYARFIFADEAKFLSLGYNYIDDQLKIWKSAYEFNIDAMIKYAESNKDYLKTALYKETMNKYYKNSTNRAIIEKWVKENVEIYRGVSEVYFFLPAYIDEVKEIYQTYPYSTYTETELTLIKDKKLGQSLRVSEGSGTEWSAYYELVKIMKSLNVLKD